jgi:hypothetical protein
MKRTIGLASLVAATVIWQAGGAFAGPVSFPDFSSTNGLELNGAAIATDDILRLTPSAGGEIGSAFTDRKEIRTDRSFDTRFKFSIHDGSINPAEGMAFVLQPGSADALGGSDLTALGYAEIDPSLAIEFDLFENPGSGDPDGNHVAFMRDGDSQSHLATGSPAFDLEGPNRWAWIEYSAKKERTKVFLNDARSKPSQALVVLNKRLKSVLGDKVRVGFTASTGETENATFDVFRWKLK